jgi:hypothetical protein
LQIRKRRAAPQARTSCIIAELLQTDKKELLSLWLADQVIAVLADEKDIAKKTLKIVKKHTK